MFKEDLLHELRFVSNAIQNARTSPPDYILWGIWPGTDMTDWEAILDDEEYRHKLRADWLTWKAPSCGRCRVVPRVKLGLP